MKLMNYKSPLSSKYISGLTGGNEIFRKHPRDWLTCICKRQLRSHLILNLNK